MVVGEDGAAHDGQVRVGADEIMGQEVGESEEPREGLAVDMHGDVAAVQGDAVLVVIDVGEYWKYHSLPARVRGMRR